MFDSCIKCGSYSPEEGFEYVDGFYICSSCGHQHPFTKSPLFVVTGAPGAGKSTLYNQVLTTQQKPDMVYFADDYLGVLDQYGGRSSLCAHMLLVSSVIAQSGRPVVLFSGTSPSEYEHSDRRNLVAEIYYLVVVCERDMLRERHWARPQWRNAVYSSAAEMEQAIESYADQNQLFIDNVGCAKPPYSLLDTSSHSRENCAEQLFGWIRGKLSENP
ncbi:MAG: hypothetical protein GKR89_09720 [Candidatus Latescibacteria bacterium]|nr:hypothetical protein [Candidatus Latescibacterota bacterium]